MERTGNDALAGCVWFMLVLVCTFPVRADELETADGTQQGTLLAIGPTLLAFDGPSGVEFHERSAVVSLKASDGRTHPMLSRASERDPAGLLTTFDGGAVQVIRRGQKIKPSIHGALAILRQGDELRSGPYGRAVLRLPGGGVATASGDAILRFTAGTAALLDGKLRLKNEDGQSLILIPEGRLEVGNGQSEVQHLRGRTRLLCLEGRATFVADEGYRIEIPRMHVLDVRASTQGQPASVAASNTNAWPLRLEYGSRWVSIQPGERVVLLGSLREAPSPSPAPEAQPELQPDAERVLASRVMRATSSFTLDREALPEKRIDQAEAMGMRLLDGDRLNTDQGDVFLEGANTRLHLLAGSELIVGPREGGAPFRLVSGETNFETAGQVSLAIDDGAIGLLRGEASIRHSDGSSHLALRKGTAGARFGDDIRAELLAPGELDLRRHGSATTLSVPPSAQSISLTLGKLDLRLRPGKSVVYTRVGERRVIALWNGSSLQFMDPIRANVVPGPEDSEVLEFVDDGTRVALRPGTYRFRRKGKSIVAEQLPAGVVLQRPGDAAPPPPTQLTERPRPREGKEHVLPNGAILITKNWGELKIKRTSGRQVTVAGLGGDLVLGPRTRSTLSREGRFTRFQTDDGRFVRHEQGASALEVRLEQDNRLRLRIGKGTRARSAEIEAGTEFDLTVRRDNYTLAFVFGQAIYLEPGQRISVTRSSGLRTYMAAGRKKD